ncbi:MAG: hypothetical protein ACD_75C00850G0003 [uncultured bacterium]|nr:MAG: hypothetical protein ACD_75C00850G0003 [uncultured bacterium]
MFGRQFSHLPRSHQQNLFVLEIAEYFFGELHGGIADGYGGGADCRFGANPFGNRKRLVQQFIEKRPGTPEMGGMPVSLLQLPENLGFANHHRIEAGGNHEQMANRRLPGKHIQVPAPLLTVDPAIEQKIDDIFLNRNIRIGDQQQFNAVAGREQVVFAQAGYVLQCRKRFFVAVGQSDLFAYLDRGSLMVYSQQQYLFTRHNCEHLPADMLRPTG